MEKEKEKSLDSAISHIVKSYGKGSIMKLGEQAAQRGEIIVIPTGALLLDLALGVGGIPRGRVTELYGPESAGKTTLAIAALVVFFRWFGGEHAADRRPSGARSNGRAAGLH